MPPPTPSLGLGPLTPLSEAARHLLVLRLGDVRRYEEAVRRHVEEDPVHDMRVATRRLRVALRTFNLREQGQQVKLLQDALGQVRDVHVQQAWLEALERELSGVPPLEPLRQALARPLPERTQALYAALNTWGRDTYPRLVAATLGLELPGRLGGERALAALRKRLERLEPQVEQVAAAPQPEPAHALRIELKKLRYRVELFSPAFHQACAQVLAALVPLQELLGSLHDTDVRLTWLAGLDTAAPGVQEAVHALRPVVQQERQRLAAELVHELGRWSAERRGVELRAQLAG
jgi:CHAD domain-containing protein